MVRGSCEAELLGGSAHSCGQAMQASYVLLGRLLEKSGCCTYACRALACLCIMWQMHSTIRVGECPTRRNALKHPCPDRPRPPKEPMPSPIQCPDAAARMHQ